MPIDIDLGDGQKLLNLGKFNVILGKNGSGKSTLLRKLDEIKAHEDAHVLYITPERGGQLKIDGGLETNAANNDNWIPTLRRKNEFNQFRQASVSDFRRLETLVLREIESVTAVRNSDFNFDIEIAKINELLDQVSIQRAENGTFEIYNKSGTESRNSDSISSGESELISLAIVVVLFSYMSKQERFRQHQNWILLDEPDVHLHPDLQSRFAKFLVDACSNVPNANVLIATHSTAFLSALSHECTGVRVGFKSSGLNEVEFVDVDDAVKTILPMFGAHPLSSVFNQRPILILEGEDDERIWSSAIRSSEARIKAYPCVAGDIQSMCELETTANKVLESVYEDSKAYSIRDRDDYEEEIEDLGLVSRSRLSCRAAENLILTDDVLENLGTDWTGLRRILDSWIECNPEHVRHTDMLAFKDAGWPRKSHSLKSLRTLIVGLSGSNKPWEVAVGQAIANLPHTNFNGNDSLEAYLGQKIVEMLELKP